MGNETGFLRDEGPLTPSVPQDIVTRTQRQRILDAMAECVAEKTFGATTISDVVAGAGISRATFYKHFPSKHTCFEATVDAFFEGLGVTAAAAYSDADSGPGQVRKATAAILELMAARPAYTRTLIVETISVDASLIDRYRSAIIEALRASLNDEGKAPSKGEIRTAYGQAQVLLASHVLGGRTAELPELLPDLVYVALLPFVGQEEALSQAQIAAR